MAHFNGLIQDDVYASLDKLSKSELEALMMDEAKMKNLVKDTSEVKRIVEEKEACMQENRRLAEANLTLEPAFSERKAKLAATHVAIRDAKLRYNDLKTKIDSLSSNYSPATVLALLQAATVEAEDKSEELTAQFLSKSIDVDTFLKEFLPLRKLCNERRLKSEKLADQLTSGRVAPVAQSLFIPGSSSGRFPPMDLPHFPPLFATNTSAVSMPPPGSVLNTAAYPSLSSIGPSYGFNIGPN